MPEKEYIEREAAIAAAFSATSLGNSAFRDVYDTVSRLRLIPAADVRPVVRGKWVLWMRIPEDYICDKCEWHSRIKTKVCPNCGADMREES